MIDPKLMFCKSMRSRLKPGKTKVARRGIQLFNQECKRKAKGKNKQGQLYLMRP